MGSQQPDERVVEAARLHAEAQGHYDRGDYVEARRHFERALTLRRAALGDDALATADTLGALALVIAQQGDPATAQPMIEATLATRRRILGLEHPDTAEAVNNLGFVRRMQGDDDAARRLYEQALAIRERVLGPDDPATANSLSNLGVVAAAQRDYDAARRYHERALRIYERAAGPDDLRTGRALNNLAAVLADQGHLAAATPLLLRSLAIHERALGPTHPSVANVLTNLADLHFKQREYVSARALYERALVIRERALGAAHPRTAESVRKLLSALTWSQEMTLAIPLNRISQALARSPGHPDAATISALRDFVDRLEAMLNRPPLAPAEDRALAEAADLQRRADTLLEGQDFAGAQAVLERALGLREGILGPYDIGHVALLKKLGVALQGQGEYERLRPLQERIVAVYIHTLGEDHPATLLARTNLISMRSQDEGFEAALPEMDQMRAALLRQVGPDHPLAQVIQNTSSLMERLKGLRDEQRDAAPIPSPQPEPPDDAALSVALAGLDDVPWRSLSHAYGPATDTPALLRALVSPEVEARRRAYHRLYGSIWHQGSVYEATAYAVPFLINLLAVPSAPGRSEILRLLAALGEDTGKRERGEDREAVAAHAAVAAGLPLYLDLLDPSHDQQMRAAACAAVAIFPEDAARSVPRLRATFETERDDLVRVWLLAALGHVMDTSREARAFFENTLARTDDVRLRFLAAVALAERAGEDTSPAAMGALTRALATAGDETTDDDMADLEEAMVGFDEFRWPGAAEIAIQRLAKVGPTRGHIALLSALQHTRDGEVAREIAEALLDLAFNDGRLQAKSTAIKKNPDGRLSVNYWEPDRQPERAYSTLTDAQRETLEALAAHDPFWEQEHDLLALYGLPTTCEELKAFLARGQQPSA